jgi:exodeoxyribonuclease V beta subunit
LLLDEELRFNLAKLRAPVSGEELADLCRRRIADLVWKALHTPLGAAGGPLWQVPPEDRICELEFHFPEHFGAPPPPEVHGEEGFLTGFMDLVFRRAGRYFLVDWKTNLLPRYATEEVAQSVVDCDYVRQYRLYLQALARWLRKIKGDAFDFHRNFGGVYYLYLRGLNGKDESTGVYFHRPTAEDLSLQAVLSEAR